MKKISKRLLAILLVVLMFTALLPATAFAKPGEMFAIGYCWSVMSSA